MTPSASEYDYEESTPSEWRYTIKPEVGYQNERLGVSRRELASGSAGLNAWRPDHGGLVI